MLGEECKQMIKISKGLLYNLSKNIEFYFNNL